MCTLLPKDYLMLQKQLLQIAVLLLFYVIYSDVNRKKQHIFDTVEPSDDLFSFI